MRIPKQTRKGLTFVELMIAMIISLPIAGSLIGTFVYVLRMQATCADQTRTRIMAEMAVNRLVEDVRNTSAQAYRISEWPKVTGRALTDDKMLLTLLDSAAGNRIVWEYDRGTRELTRTVQDLTASGTVIRTYIGRFADMDFQERAHSDEVCTYTATTTADTYTDPDTGETYEVPGEYQLVSCSTVSTINGITIRGRSFLSVSPRNSVWKEVDGDGDGDFRSDAFGKTMFGRQNNGDDPIWQHIFNLEVGFRNT